MARFVDGFEGRIELRNQLATNDGRVAAEIKDWSKIQSSSEQSIDVHSVGGGRRRRAGDSTVIKLRKLGYETRLNKNVTATEHRSISIEVWTLDPQTRSRRSLASDGNAPNGTVLNALLEPAINSARASDVYRVVCIFSPIGWSQDAISLMNAAESTDRFLNPYVSVALMGPGLSDLSRNPSDTVMTDFVHYLTPSFEDEVASCRQLIREELNYLEVFLLSRGESEFGFIRHVVQVAADSLVRLGEVELQTESGDDILIKRGDR